MRHDMWYVRYTGKRTFIRSYVRSLILLQISLLAIHAHPCLKLCSDLWLYPVLSQMWVTRVLRGCILGGRQLLFRFASKRRKATNAVHVGMSFLYLIFRRSRIIATEWTAEKWVDKRVRRKQRPKHKLGSRTNTLLVTYKIITRMQ